MSCVFFFFKQKTAYEMRISDWSSDVCSSDLLDSGGLAAVVLAGAGFAVGSGALGLDGVEGGNCAVRTGAGASRTTGAGRRGSSAVALCRPMDPATIGRASCRERVCQYV